MRLSELMPRLDGARLVGDPTVTIKGITHDSRSVRPGMVFAALPGARFHGAAFVDQAIDRGAAAVLSDRRPPAGTRVPWIVSPTVRAQMAAAAWALCGNPQDRLQLVGVTGTNGKSTTVDLICRMLEADGMPTALFGTLGHSLPGGGFRPTERTTPEATDLAPLLSEAVDRGALAAVMEASSHALALDRLAGLPFKVAVWTNLSHDHLDFHHTMEEYFAAKTRLFTEHLAVNGHRVLPVDDPWASRLLESPAAGDVSWGLSSGDVHARAVASDLEGTAFTLCLPDVELNAELPLLGEHNLRNALAAAAAAVALGTAPASIVEALAGATPLSGRLERVPAECPFPIFVDYAHTPEGLRAVLGALRSLSHRRLIVVFGAGGDRDTAKRGLMGRIAGELADLAIVTSDNPRSEDPAAIAEAVAEGVRSVAAHPEVVLDRRQAIARALEAADRESLVLVAGKGHERSQTTAGRTASFVDRDEILDLTRRRMCG